MSSLDQIKRVYSRWGRHPGLYALQDQLTFLGRPGTIRGAAVAALALPPGARVLEVACGTGRNFPHLVHAVGSGGAIVGLDYTQEMLDAAETLCRGRGWHHVRLVQGDAAELDVGEEDFDGVLCVLGISAIPGWREALRRCHAVLRPGGMLSVCDARLFPGRLRALNPLVEALYRRGAAWDPSRDIPSEIERIFGNLRLQAFNRRSFYVASARKTGR